MSDKRKEIIQKAAEFIRRDPTVTEENLEQKCREFVNRCVEEGKKDKK